MGLLAGTVLGAGLGMLFAPKAGTELRNQLTDQAGKLRATANDTYHQATDKVGQIVDRGKDAYDRARTNVGDTTGLPTGPTGTVGGGSTGPSSFSSPNPTNRI
jgi:gas vesicle protein